MEHDFMNELQSLLRDVSDAKVGLDEFERRWGIIKNAGRVFDVIYEDILDAVEHTPGFF